MFCFGICSRTRKTRFLNSNPYPLLIFCNRKHLREIYNRGNFCYWSYEKKKKQKVCLYKTLPEQLNLYECLNFISRDLRHLAGAKKMYWNIMACERSDKKKRDIFLETRAEKMGIAAAAGQVVGFWRSRCDKIRVWVM